MIDSIQYAKAQIKEGFFRTGKAAWTHKETLAKVAISAGLLGTALYFRKPLQEGLSALWERPLDPCHPEVQYPPSSFIKETLVHENPVSYYASLDKQVGVVQLKKFVYEKNDPSQDGFSMHQLTHAVTDFIVNQSSLAVNAIKEKLGSYIDLPSSLIAIPLV